MKTRIFLILFFTLFFFAEVVSSEKEGVLYYRLENGSWRYFENGDDRKDGKYQGGIKNGRPHGQGILNSSIGKFIGEFKNGLTDGFGMFHYIDGGKYIGNWKNDNSDGQGIFFTANGNVFIGKFKNSVFQEGIIKYADGKQFIGKVKNFLPIIGEFKAPKFGIKIIGTFKKDSSPLNANGYSESHPKLLIKYINGKESMIPIKEEKLFRWLTPLGVVWKTFGNKQKHGFYFGQVAEGVPNGQGFLTLSSGSTYEGGFKDGLMHGVGEMIGIDQGISVKTIGQFKFDKANGQGIVNFPDGSIFIGEFREDQPWENIYFDKDFNVLDRWVNGEKETNLDNLH